MALDSLEYCLVLYGFKQKIGIRKGYSTINVRTEFEGQGNQVITVCDV